jgi:hypothetical protein
MVVSAANRQFVRQAQCIARIEQFDVRRRRHLSHGIVLATVDQKCRHSKSFVNVDFNVCILQIEVIILE